jgi:Trypsin
MRLEFKNKKLKEKKTNTRAISRRWQKRPVSFGVSGGNGADLLRNSNCCSGGTLGCQLQNQRNKKRYILSNAHVFVGHEPAIMNNYLRTKVNDQITQPGTLDFTSQCNKSRVKPNSIGQLKKWTRIAPSTNPNMDLAVARTWNKVRKGGYILNVGRPINSNATNAVIPKVGMEVQKNGRTTNKTTGKITVINATVLVGYDSCFPGKGSFTKRFTNTFFINKKGFSAAGDSGSVILTKNRYPVGLLFAGGGNTTVCLGMRQVLSRVDSLFNVRRGTFRVLGKPRPTTQTKQIQNKKVRNERLIKALSVQKSHENKLLEQPGVIGVGIENDSDNPSLVVITKYQTKDTVQNMDDVPVKYICIDSDIKAF